MLSRMADSLFWLSRYVERAENLARTIEVAQRMVALPSAYADTSNEWESAISAAAARDAFFRSHEVATRENVTAFLLNSPDNPSSIEACIDIARANARSVRTAITKEMWEILNDAWNDLQRVDLDRMNEQEISRVLDSVKAVSLRFDGAAYRTMLRTDAYWFQRLGTFVERADNMARLLDVKYFLLLPDKEPIGGSLDYFQWAAILRSVNALTSFHWVYRENVRPWLVADFLILRSEQPRSLVSCQRAINNYLDQLAEDYGRQGPAQRHARQMLTGLENSDMTGIFQIGLHEYLNHFLAENNRLAAAIRTQYLT
ncbi:MAG: alpha-E domain-containing protein [Hyphomicrobiaceae bacterium]|nr:alpha-E domain-containing protein [Hyphomicrobiaceae bacterium]